MTKLNKIRLEGKRAILLRSMDQTREGALDPDAVRSLMDKTRSLGVIESALADIASGVYGQCRLCQRDIPRWRLIETPWITHCASCEPLAATRFYRAEKPGGTDSVTATTLGFRARHWLRKVRFYASFHGAR